MVQSVNDDISPFLNGDFHLGTRVVSNDSPSTLFPCFFVGAFIEVARAAYVSKSRITFPFLFGRAFIEAMHDAFESRGWTGFPFLFGRAFIEARTLFCR